MTLADGQLSVLITYELKVVPSKRRIQVVLRASARGGRQPEPAMRKAISAVFTRVAGRTEVLYECRNCGTNLDAGETACSACGHTDIAVYEFTHEE